MSNIKGSLINGVNRLRQYVPQMKMKKTTITVCILIMLGTIWTGAAWLTGKKIENRLNELVQQSNTTFSQMIPTAGITITQQNYQRGIFSSTAQLIIEPLHQGNTGNAPLSGPNIIIVDEKIEHGPLPFSQLTQFKFMPAMATIRGKLINTEIIKPLFARLPNAVPLTSNTRVSYWGAVTSEINLLPVDFTDKETGEHIATSASAMKIDYDGKQNNVKLNTTMDEITVTLPGDEAEPVMLIRFSGLSLDSDTHQGIMGIPLGEQVLELKNITATQNSNNVIKLDGLTLQNSVSADNKTLSWKMQYALNNLMQHDQSLGHGQLILTLSPINLTSLQQFSDNVRPHTEQQTDSEEAYLQTWLTHLPLLLKDNPEINIAPLSWKNSQGESHVNLAVRLSDPSIATSQYSRHNDNDADDSDDDDNNDINPDERKLTRDVDSVIKTLNGHLSIDKKMARELITNWLITEGDDENTAEARADKQVKMLSQKLQAMGIAVERNNQITSSVQYVAGKVTVNGKTSAIGRFLSQMIINMFSPELLQYD